MVHSDRFNNYEKSGLIATVRILYVLGTHGGFDFLYKIRYKTFQVRTPQYKKTQNTTLCLIPIECR